MSAQITAKKPLVLNFKDDSLTTVSRETLQKMAKRLGFNETQATLYALARLRDELVATEEKDPLMPLTRKQLDAIAKAEPKSRGKVLGTLLP